MAQINPRIIAEIDPSQPVQEICDIIAAVLVYHQEKEKEILTSLQNTIRTRLQEVEDDG